VDGREGVEVGQRDRPLYQRLIAPGRGLFQGERTPTEQSVEPVRFLSIVPLIVPLCPFFEIKWDEVGNDKTVESPMFPGKWLHRVKWGEVGKPPSLN
jgi:hypothetical protein